MIDVQILRLLCVRRGGLVRRTILIPICNAKRPAIQISNYICNSPQSYSGRRSNSSSNICNSFTDTSQVGYPKSPTIFQKSPQILLYTQLFSHFVTQKSKITSLRPAGQQGTTVQKNMFGGIANLTLQNCWLCMTTLSTRKTSLKNVEDKMILSVVGKLVRV